MAGTTLPDFGLDAPNGGLRAPLRDLLCPPRGAYGTHLALPRDGTLREFILADGRSLYEFAADRADASSASPLHVYVDAHATLAAALCPGGPVRLTGRMVAEDVLVLERADLP